MPAPSLRQTTGWRNPQVRSARNAQSHLSGHRTLTPRIRAARPEPPRSWGMLPMALLSTSSTNRFSNRNQALNQNTGAPSIPGFDDLPGALIAYDAQGRVTRANRAALRILGFASEGEIVGSKAADAGWFRTDSA